MNVDEAPEGLSAYERQRWSELQKWRSATGKGPRFKLPEPVRRAGEAVNDKAVDIWNAVPGNDAIETRIAQAINGSFHMMIDGVATVVDEEKIASRVSRGSSVEVRTFDEFTELDLSVLDRARPDQKMMRSLVAAGHGAATGFIAGGSVTAGAASGGMGALPAAGVVAATAVGDAGALLGNMIHAAALLGGHYGFDPRRHDEHALLMSVLGAGLAKEGAKVAAIMKVRELALMLAAKQTVAQLSQHQLYALMKRIYAALLLKTAKRNIAKGLPVVGIALGAGINYGAVRSMVDAAEHLYPERFLFAKYGSPSQRATSQASIEMLLEPEFDEADKTLIQRVAELPHPDEGTADGPTSGRG